MKDDALAQRIEVDHSTAGLDAHHLAMLDYASKLTRTPGEMKAADVAALRAVGFSDADVLHVAEIVGYYAYANRIADGLGVELEE